MKIAFKNGKTWNQVQREKQNNINWVKKGKKSKVKKTNKQKHDKQTTKGCSSGDNYHTNILAGGIFLSIYARFWSKFTGVFEYNYKYHVCFFADYTTDLYQTQLVQFSNIDPQAFSDRKAMTTLRRTTR